MREVNVATETMERLEAELAADRAAKRYDQWWDDEWPLTSDFAREWIDDLKEALPRDYEAPYGMDADLFRRMVREASRRYPDALEASKGACMVCLSDPAGAESYWSADEVEEALGDEHTCADCAEELADRFAEEGDR